MSTSDASLASTLSTLSLTLPTEPRSLAHLTSEDARSVDLLTGERAAKAAVAIRRDLLALAGASHELLMTCPKCSVCGAVSTRGLDGKYVCDAHDTSRGPGRSPTDLPWAGIVRTVLALKTVAL